MTGSDIQVSATSLDDVDAVRAAPGVRAAAGLFTAYGVRLALGANTPSVTAVFADLAALHEVRPDIPDLPAGAILVSQDIADRGQGSTTLNGAPVTIAGTVPPTGLPGTTRSWVLADLADAAAVFGDTPRIDMVLVSAEPGADIAATAEVVRDVVTDAQASDDRDHVTVLDTSTQRADAAAQPSVLGAILGLITAAGLSLVLCIIAVALEALGAASRRSRTRAILRLLGMSSRQVRGVLAWEFAPAALAALVTGTGFGILLAVLVASLVNLRNLTGGAVAISANVPWVWVGVVAVVVAILVAGTAAVTSAGSRRLDAAAAVKMGAE
jgi:putative ABC transport system permease protein